jgi:putative membrane protein
MIRRILRGACCLSLVVAAGIVYAASLSNADRQFMITAAKSNMTEVREGQMAQSQGSSASVKDFGKALVQDHTRAEHQLADLSAKTGVPIPTGINTVNHPTIQQLTGLKGASFDRRFANDEIATHRRAIALFKHEAEYGRDPAVKAYASQTIPVLEKHLRMAEQCAKRG